MMSDMTCVDCGLELIQGYMIHESCFEGMLNKNKQQAAQIQGLREANAVLEKENKKWFAESEKVVGLHAENQRLKDKIQRIQSVAESNNDGVVCGIIEEQAEQIKRLENNIKAHINTDRVIFLEAENAKLKRIIDPHLDADGNFDRQGFDWKCLEWEDENQRLKEEYKHKEKVLDDVWQKMHYLESREYQECKVFVDHIKRHLSPNQFVVCKICNKTINEIWHEALAAQPQKESEGC